MSDGRIPAGADVPWAPWNEPEIEEYDFEAVLEDDPLYYGDDDSRAE
jgi:hypothetical protein